MMINILLICFSILVYATNLNAACTEIKSDSFESGFDWCTRYTAGCSVSPGSGDVTCCDGDGDGHNWALAAYTVNNCGSQSSTQARAGTYSVKFDHDWNDPDWPGYGDDWRCEYWWIDYPYQIAAGTDLWLRWSIFFPADWTPPTNSEGYIIFQNHQDVTCRTVGGPPVSMNVRSTGKIYVTRVETTIACPTSKTDVVTELGSVTPGQWHDFVIHLIANHSNNGTLEVWFNGTQKLSVSGVDTMYNQDGYASYGTWSYLKFGIYTWYWKFLVSPNEPNPSRIILYYDAFKMGDSDCSYSDMLYTTTPPSVTGCTIQGATPSQHQCAEAYWPVTPVTMACTTDIAATCKYDDTDTTYALMDSTFSTTGTTSHSQSITVNCGQSYTYYVRCSTAGIPATTSYPVTFSLDKDPPPRKTYNISELESWKSHL